MPTAEKLKAGAGKEDDDDDVVLLPPNENMFPPVDGAGAADVVTAAVSDLPNAKLALTGEVETGFAGAVDPNVNIPDDAVVAVTDDVVELLDAENEKAAPNSGLLKVAAVVAAVVELLEDVVVPKAPKFGNGRVAAAAVVVDADVVPKANAVTVADDEAVAAVVVVVPNDPIFWGDLLAAEASVDLSPKENAGSGGVEDFVEASALGLGVSVFRLNVTVEDLPDPEDGLDCPSIDGGEDIVPTENGVDVVEVTEDSVAVGAALELLDSAAVVVDAWEGNPNPPVLAS